MADPDFKSLAALHSAAFLDTRAWSADEFSSLLSSPHCFCVSDDGGFALGRCIVDESELLTLAVHPSHRRKGLGRTLLKAFESESQNRRATRAFLEVAEDNAAALALYQAAGYQITANRPDYYRRDNGSQIAASLMEKTLN
ncbi:Mycothiol acetyltransferase [Shimia sp. SK013]|uniref:GNAT family N-acetyltransferase n=1 Tax=Shimia sp. SK013 TaxID=1389006 RepID=UPI0006B5BE19|nr:GNAT family N-acetyltransferase [Shimia sp. SK013]KPA21716.1 Mycothiol acetyltransferase [Shimia sp. SK013]